MDRVNRNKERFWEEKKGRQGKSFIHLTLKLNTVLMAKMYNNFNKHKKNIEIMIIDKQGSVLRLSGHWLSIASEEELFFSGLLLVTYIPAILDDNIKTSIQNCGSRAKAAKFQPPLVCGFRLHKKINSESL